MSGIDLLPFQADASDQIVDRYNLLVEDADRPHQTARWAVPYYQALSALTGAGKTPILADTVSQLRSVMHCEPIILWISKAKAVVEQTEANFESGGKYAHLIPDFVVISLSDLSQDHVRDTTTPIVALATVGSFNDKDRADGTRRIHKPNLDKNKDALWKVLRDRPGIKGERRPLVIVYDEAQNLSDQQTDLLLELEPDVILVASATIRTPGKLGKLIDRLREHGWDESQLITGVPSSKVVSAGLVKRQIILGGYNTIMEAVLDDMLDMMSVVCKKTLAHQASFSPKAIYVCRTNISQLDGTRDSASRPFVERQAPPILIWRYLVEKKGVDPADIAVYCDLKVDRRHNPPPEEFNLFTGGEDDFATFRSGNYHHIIFNQSLQEGWDDPSCCFAYIDKSMGSPVQVEQVIGRVLRQPGAKHYPDADLNSAHFYIRIDDNQIFPEILATVRKKLGAEIPELRIDGYDDRRDRNRTRSEPKQILTIPEIHIDLELEPLLDAQRQVIDFTKDVSNVVGKGDRFRAIQSIGDDSEAKIVVEAIEHSNRVMARWLVRRRVQSLYPRAAMAIDWSSAKLDARVEITSPAARNLRVAAEDLVNTYLENADLTFEEENLYAVGPIIINPSKAVAFKHSLHSAYSDLSGSEMLYAEAIDELGLPWVRNPSNGGYSIPLLKTGGNFNFFPDFLVWKNGIVFALDPKGDHLINDAAGRKLLNIRDEKGKQKVVVRLFTEGKWDDPEHRKSSQGFTVWSMSNAGIRARYFDTIPKAVQGALKL
jgi:type III restriction enzyme